MYVLVADGIRNLSLHHSVVVYCHFEDPREPAPVLLVTTIVRSTFASNQDYPQRRIAGTFVDRRRLSQPIFDLVNRPLPVACHQLRRRAKRPMALGMLYDGQNCAKLVARCCRRLVRGTLADLLALLFVLQLSLGRPRALFWCLTISRICGL